MNKDDLPAEYFDQLMNENDAAAFLSYSVRALQNWRVRGGGPRFVKVSARSIRYCRRDLLAWVEQRTVSHTSEVPEPA
tara:strand:- start:8116 stop:8349 length:234 start_codon:yes stop_codon:yes gene_type:complete